MKHGLIVSSKKSRWIDQDYDPMWQPTTSEALINLHLPNGSEVSMSQLSEAYRDEVQKILEEGKSRFGFFTNSEVWTYLVVQAEIDSVRSAVGELTHNIDLKVHSKISPDMIKSPAYKPRETLIAHAPSIAAELAKRLYLGSHLENGTSLKQSGKLRFKCTNPNETRIRIPYSFASQFDWSKVDPNSIALPDMSSNSKSDTHSAEVES